MEGWRGGRDLSSRNKQIVTVPVLLQFVAGNKSRRIIWSSIGGRKRGETEGEKAGEIGGNRGRNKEDVEERGRRRKINSRRNNQRE